MKSMFTRLGLLALFITALAGCSGGDDGATGAQGPAGPAGATGPAGPTGPAAGNNAATMTPAQWANSQFTGTDHRRHLGSDGKPVVSFKVTDAAGNGVSGSGQYFAGCNSVAPSLTNLSFAFAKLVPGDNTRRINGKARAGGSATS